MHVQSNLSVLEETKMKSKTTFTFLLPTNIPKDWRLEIKEPEQIKDNANKIQLHFLDKTSTDLKVAITESKAKEDFKELEDYGENVKIKDKIGVFHAVTSTKKIKVQGGTLSWIQDGTLVSLFSLSLSKSELIKLANAMEKY